jgi:outer membrane protein
MMKFIVSVICLMLLSISGFAQETWNLERCIQEALEKNLTIEQIKLNKEGFDISGKQLRRNRIPTLNMNTNLGFTVGRVINPASNNFETENSLYQSYGVSTGVMLYTGGRTVNTIKQNDVYVQATEKDIQQAQEDLALNVASAYLRILFAYENLKIANDRINLTKDQLANMDKMIAAGSRPEGDRYDILSQLANDESTQITAQNTIDIEILGLKQLMLMDPGTELEIEKPELNFTTLEPLENESFEAIYQVAIDNQPQIAAAELRQEANEIDITIARSQRLPSLSLGGNFGTNWSSLYKVPTEYSFGTSLVPGVYVDGQADRLSQDFAIPTAYENVSYGDQLDQGIGYGFGATLSIPILNNYSAQARVEQAKINVFNADIETEKLKQNLKTNIQTALANAKAAKKSLEGAEAAAYAARVSLENADKKAALGVIGNFEYLSARNRSDAAENNLLISRYDYYFQIQVLKYYMGRGISLD